jgi:hypothetical protein
MINHVGPSANTGHYTSIGEAANGTFYCFDDASVHPISLQSALHTSAYVIFYELTLASRDAMLTPGPRAPALEAPWGPEPGCTSPPVHQQGEGRAGPGAPIRAVHC